MSFRSRLRPVKRSAGHLIERLWELGFYATAGLTRRTAQRWMTPGGQRVLIVAPHPDDEAMGCAGTLLLHAASADRVWLAIATDGRRSTAIADPTQMSVQRRREAGDAARLMGAERLEWIGLPEGDWNVPELRSALEALIRNFAPNIIYAPSRVDFHPEHLKTAHALALALETIGPDPSLHVRVRVYQVQVPLSALMVNLVSDVSAVQSQCEAVLRAYTSQAGSVHCCHRQRRYSASSCRTEGHAEVFWEMTPERYCALHREPPAVWPKVFRGMRQFPLSDPLAYLAGTAERRRILSGDGLPRQHPAS